MKIINRNNLPEAIFKFLQNDLYDGVKGGESYSVTELLKPIREIVLTRRHWNEIEVDAEDRVWSLFGQGVHAVLEKEEGAEPVERLYGEIDGHKISGKFDRIKDGVIYDYKVTSAWTVVYDSRRDEWTDQLSGYRWLYWKKYNKELGNIGHIIAILRDWSKKEVKPDGKYPVGPIVDIPINLVSLPKTEFMLRNKLRRIETATKTGVLPECTNDERWYNAKKNAFNKCEKYCPAFKFCLQANK